MLEEKDFAEDKPKSRSALDNLPVINAAFKSFPDYVGGLSAESLMQGEGRQSLVPVASCKSCGSPIYGPRQVLGGTLIQTQRTCNCPPRELEPRGQDKGGLPNVRHT